MEVNIKSYQNNKMKEVRMNKCLPHRSCEEKHFIILKQAGTALESSSKTGSFDRISNRQEFWSIEMGHLTYGNRALEVLRERKYF